MSWKNISSYSQRDTERIPKTWEFCAGGLKIIVTRHIHHAPNEWVLNCEPWFSQYVIGTGTADEAKQAAVDAVRGKLSKTAAALSVHNA